MRKIRVGKISYLNLYPYFFWLQRYATGYTFLDDVPYRLNRMLRMGIVDVSPSSSIEYLRAPERYHIIDGHSVSSVEKAGSVLLFSKVPIENLGGREILCTHQSDTSVALLWVILRRFYDLKVSLKRKDSSLSEVLKNSVACLLIGDDALKASKSSDKSIYLYDLGCLWYERTGLPFIFALWITKRVELVEQIKNDLDRARDFMKTHLKEIALGCPDRAGLSVDELVDYWQTLSYDLKETHMESLKLFNHLLKETGWKD